MKIYITNKSMDHTFYFACAITDMDTVMNHIENASNEIKQEMLDYCLCLYSEKGNLKLVQLFIEKGATQDYYYPFLKACMGGYVDIVQMILDKGMDCLGYLNEGFLDACRNGSMALVQLLINYGATDFDGGFINACNKGHLDIVKLLLLKDINNYNGGLIVSSNTGQNHIVKYMLDCGATNKNIGLRIACYNQNLPLVEIFLEYGADQLNDGLHAACYSEIPVSY